MALRQDSFSAEMNSERNRSTAGRRGDDNSGPELELRYSDRYDKPFLSCSSLTVSASKMIGQPSASACLRSLRPPSSG